jgi:hypothetical protein
MRFSAIVGIFTVMLTLVTGLIFASCVASYTGVNTKTITIQSIIKPGDTVKIVTKDKEETSFVVVEVTDEAIVGESETVLFTDITKLQKQTVSGGENFWIWMLTGEVPQVW